MIWNRKVFWFGVTILFFAVYASSFWRFGASYVEALGVAAAAAGIYVVGRVLWRTLRLYKALEWIAWHSPLKTLPKSMTIIIIAFFLMAGLYITTVVIIRHMSRPPDAPKLTYTEFVAKAEAGGIAKYVILKYDAQLLQAVVIVFFTDLTDGKNKWTYFANAPAYIPQVTPEEWLRLLKYDVEPKFPFPMTYLLMQVLQGFTMSVPFFFFLWFIAGGGLRSMLHERSTIKKATLQGGPPIYFKEIGGMENAIKECGVFVRMLRQPDLYKKLTATMPKGLMISGPPGTGKTMLARAVATEAGVQKFLITGADFGQPLVGLGRETVVNFFDLLMRNAPCVGIIDEFEAAAPPRGASPMDSSERIGITDVILSKQDEIQKRNLPILVIAITNLLGKVDEAAKRPGRFDRPVVVSYPGKQGRAQIIKIHLTMPEVAPMEDPSKAWSEKLANELAEITAGFSGAALATLVNEAKISAGEKIESGLRKGNFVARQDFYDALPRAITRSQKADLIFDEEELECMAWHEGGHTYFSWLFKDATPVLLTFLEPHGETGGMAIGGGDIHLSTKSKLIARIKVTLGGYAIEKARAGEVTVGSSNDLRNATRTARAMFFNYGMGRQGPIAIDALRGEEGSNFTVHLPGLLAQEGEKEVQEVLRQAEEELLKLLEDKDGKHYTTIKRLAEALREEHMLSVERIKELVGAIEQI